MVAVRDFVADMRAPTPSAAAELVVECKDAFEDKLRGASRRLLVNLRQSVLQARSRLSAARSSYVFRQPGNLALQYRQHLDNILMRMQHQLAGGVRDGHQGLDSTQMRLERTITGGVRDGLQQLEDASLRTRHAITSRLQHCLQHVGALDAQLRSLSPLSVLKRGYSVTRDMQGGIIRSTDAVSPGQRVVTTVEDGRFESEVK